MAKKKQSESIAIKSTMVLRPRKLIADREEKVRGKGNKTVGSGMTKKTIRSPKPEKNINATGSTMVLRPRKQTEEKIEVKGKKTVGSGMTRIVDSGIGKIGRKRKVMAYESNSKTAENVVKRVKAMNKNIKETSPTVRRPKPEKTIHTTGRTMVLRPRTPKAKVEMPAKKNEKTKGKMSVEVNKKVGGKKKTVATGKIKIGNAVKIGTYAKRKLAADKGDIKVGRSITHKNNQLVKRKKTDNVVTKSIFPAEIIMEILSWLPVKFFGTPMIVCKQWYALIQDRHFIEKQMSRNFSYTESRVRQGYKKVCSCQGLRLERNTSTKRYCIRNPNTKQFLELPDPPTGKFDIIFRYVPPTCNYKIVLIYDKNNIRCCDLSVGNDELSWRLLKMPTRDYLKRNIKIFSTNLFREVVHCVRVFASGDDMFEEVVSLDLGTEQHKVARRSIQKLGKCLDYKL